MGRAATGERTGGASRPGASLIYGPGMEVFLQKKRRLMEDEEKIVRLRVVLSDVAGESHHQYRFKTSIVNTENSLGHINVNGLDFVGSLRMGLTSLSLGLPVSPRSPALQPECGGCFTIPPSRMNSKLDDSHSFCLLGCCHGLALIFLASRKQVLVWDPVTSDQHRIAVPSVFDVDENPIHGAVLRAAGEVGHFQVVLVEASGVDEQHTRMVACVYSSETGVWGNLTSTSVQPEGTSSLYFTGMPSVLVGSSLYMPLVGDFVGILEFNLERHSLAVIQVPVDMFESDINFAVMRGDGAGLGLIILSGCNAQLWKRETDFDGVASWGMRTTIELDKLQRGALAILGFAEENNVVFLSAVDGVFMVQLEPLQFKKLHVSRNWLYHYPFESVYTAGPLLISRGHTVEDVADHGETECLESRGMSFSQAMKSCLDSASVLQ
uniref:F-box protein AT5G49610-like beta-propeller domain-containing protein n=1 Tax=Aegilops tauschii TaxID=37682 RepID=M8BDC3_AEGTA